MDLHQYLKSLAHITPPLLSTTLAKQSGAGANTRRDSGSSSLSLDPLNATIFAFFVIFSIFTALQAVQAVINMIRGIRKYSHSDSIKSHGSGNNIGRIFPTLLPLSILTLMISYVLRATYVAKVSNRNTGGAIPKNDVAWTSAWSIMDFLHESLLLAALFALISHRETTLSRIQNPSSSSVTVLRRLKLTFDTLLAAALLAVGLASVGVEAIIRRNIETPGLTESHIVQDILLENRLSLAWDCLLLVAVVDVAVFAGTLYSRVRSRRIDDCKTAWYMAFIISPAYIVYAVFWVVQMGVFWNGVITIEEAERWSVAGVVVGCVTKFIVLVGCLMIGMTWTKSSQGQVD